ncbi:hypothetical protein JAAARDRAFT_34715 [Jaapia argillacea MUCL 33604]|uniref:Uncharacterized protein n=1 Tax=Jaapia argillacea MUCL 33604 TaxID=933084 RepID=A0A067PT26_9AGAM|nr:hypothetical protein JAAARDRAFT_34715 [Jaapia argillacea MUCL 33604]
MGLNFPLPSARALNRPFVAAFILFTLTQPTVARIPLDQCLLNITNLPFGTVGGTDVFGNPVSNISEAVGVTYDLCNSACGTGAEPFDASVFSQQFSAWLLPYLALASQLPFGAHSIGDNLSSVLLILGSPAIAAYSLALTVLNSRWIARRWRDLRITYPNSGRALRVLSSLQHAPIQITTDDGLLAALVCLPENDEWWNEMVERLDYTYTWTISTASSLLWVAAAYWLTVVDSIHSLAANIESNGQGPGSLWLWLVPIVAGWLQLSPKCDSQKLQDALVKSNRIAYSAVGGHPEKAGIFSDERGITVDGSRKGALTRDQERAPPVFFYARFFSWVQAAEEVTAAFQGASEKARRHIPVEAILREEAYLKGYRPTSSRSENSWRGDGVLPDYRRGSVRQLLAYCDPGNQEVYPRSRWGPDVLWRVGIASLVALGLQWGTTGAAIMIAYNTPTVGLGCRSGAYVLYGVAATVVWILLVTSSVLAHYAYPDSHLSHSVPTSRAAALFSVLLRRMGKILATLNAIWLILACLFQFSNVFNRCWCDSSRIGLGGRAYVVLDPTEILPTMENWWIAGVALASSCSFLFFAFVGMLNDIKY